MALVTIGVGVFLVAGGIYALRNPRIQAARDVELITSEQAGSAERNTAYVVGVILIVAGLAFVSLGL